MSVQDPTLLHPRLQEEGGGEEKDLWGNMRRYRGSMEDLDRRENSKELIIQIKGTFVFTASRDWRGDTRKKTVLIIVHSICVYVC
jgi:hypothetical protein